MSAAGTASSAGAAPAAPAGPSGTGHSAPQSGGNRAGNPASGGGAPAAPAGPSPKAMSSASAFLRSVRESQSTVDGTLGNAPETEAEGGETEGGEGETPGGAGETTAEPRRAEWADGGEEAGAAGAAGGADDGAEGGAEGGAAAAGDDAAELSAFAKTFGLKLDASTPAARDGIVSDVLAVRAKVRGGGQSDKQPAGAAPPATDGQQQTGQPAASAVPPSKAASPEPPAKPGDAAAAQAPAGSPAGSSIPQPYSDDQIKALDTDYGPEVADMGKRCNALTEAVNALLSKQQDPGADKVSALEQRVQQLDALHGEYVVTTQVMPAVTKFVEAQVKAGFPAVPPDQLRSFALEAATYLAVKNPDGKDPAWTPERAMHAVYLAWTGDELKAKADAAGAAGEQRVIKGMRKTARRFDVSGGPGTLTSAPRKSDPRGQALSAARKYLGSVQGG